MSQRILITGARAPAALHLARLLDGAGCVVVMADSLRWPIAAASNACQSYIRLPSANGAQHMYCDALQDALEKHKIDLVIPTCEEVFHLSALWDSKDMSAKLFAPKMSLLRAAHSKSTFIELAASLGLAVPQTWLLQSTDDVRALEMQTSNLVFKPVWSRFATEVNLRPQQVDITPSKAKPWIAQEFVAGEEVCAYAVAVHGKLTMLSCYLPICRAGKGAGIAFKPVVDPNIHDYVRRFIEGTDWHGQVAFDFIRRSDGTVVAIECNPRATSGVHFFDAPQAFADGVFQGEVCAPQASQTLAIKAAVLLYGPNRFGANHRQMQDVIAWPGDPRPTRRQFLATLEIAALALRHRISLTAATTHDIAWNGD